MATANQDFERKIENVCFFVNNETGSCRPWEDEDREKFPYSYATFEAFADMANGDIFQTNVVIDMKGRPHLSMWSYVGNVMMEPDLQRPEDFDF